MQTASSRRRYLGWYEPTAPDKYTFVPKGTPTGSAYNVAQAYACAAEAFRADTDFEVDFALAVTRHKLIDKIERAASWK